jgi:gamma-glutamylcyclotransferase (GGCT)/AIG2-like uncharacterized protein YtfP
MKFMVYGTLKQGWGNHRILKEGGATYLGKAVTKGGFVMAGYGVPFVWPAADGLPLQGEVYDIGNPAGGEGHERAGMMLHRLDMLESNGHVYERKLHTVRMIENATGIKPLPRDQGEEHEVWIYECMYRDPPPASHPEVQGWKNEAGYLEWTREQHMPRYEQEDEGV